MTIGIYGGSFNPIHQGHLALGRWLVRHTLVDELWFMVSPQNPLKPAAGLLDDNARLRLARLAVGRSRRLRVSDFEFSLPRPSFMADTLAALRQAHPEHDFVLVIGADNWHDFPRWHRPDDILAHHRLIIYPRPGYDIDDTTLPHGVTLAATPLHDISSTQIRRAIASDRAYAGQGLHPRVWKEIQACGYYTLTD
ncbi:MAG: nicotinate-nucleotide adenylyltransferase [Bacteroidaceae bacterium]|nr:nicotinate-nucleotide adenylyltransferase [Bacteroidaceae bacterium]